MEEEIKQQLEKEKGAMRQKITEEGEKKIGEQAKLFQKVKDAYQQCEQELMEFNTKFETDLGS